MKLLELKYTVFNELAAMIHSKYFEPGYETWIMKDNEVKGNKVIIGIKKGTKEKNIYNPDGTLFPLRDPNDKQNYEPDFKKAIKHLKSWGYVPLKTGQETGKTRRYPTGNQEEGSTSLFSGTLFHGTTEYDFLSIMGERKGEHHLKSLKGGDALSLSVAWQVSNEFAKTYGFVFEFKVKNMKVYHVPRDEDDFDEVDYGDADAIVIPSRGKFEEEEIAVVNKDYSSFMTPVAVYVPGNRAKTRIPITNFKKDGEWEAFYRTWLIQVFGEEVIGMVNKYGDPHPDLGPQIESSFEVSWKNFFFDLGDKKFTDDTELNGFDIGEEFDSVKAFLSAVKSK